MNQSSTTYTRLIWLARPVGIAIGLLSLVFSLGALGYVLIEGWHPLDALWMILITLTSIGYGEVHPLSSYGRLWTSIIIVSGLSVYTYTLSHLTSALVEGELLNEFRARRRGKRLQKLQNHFIIVGAGRLGRAVLEEIKGTGRSICVIESDPEVARRCEEETGAVVITGNGADDAVLRRAGIERAAGMAIAVPSGAQAIFATLSARALAPELPIATRAGDQEEAIKARRAGATSVVSPFQMGGWRMANGLVRPEASEFLDLATFAAHEDLLLDELLLRADSPSVGNTLRTLSVHAEYGVLIVAIRRQDGELIPAPGATIALRANDVVIVIGKPEGVQRFERELI
ncbi:MAG: potassium channel protein [Myxococcota bacterium]